MHQVLGKWVALLIMPFVVAGQPRQAAVNASHQAQSSSTLSYENRNDTETVAITNVAYEMVGSSIPGRPRDERMMLRKTVRTQQIVGDIGMDASTTVEAWPLGSDLKEKPLYSLSVAGVDPTSVNTDLLVISRGLEDTQWWSAYKLGSGQHLFDTYVPLLQFSTTRDIETLRYVGVDVPPDDAIDARLKAPNVVAVLTYASGDRVIREALLTCDDTKRAQLLRSYADSARNVEYSGGNIRLSIRQNFPSAPATITIAVPIAKDDMDFSRSQLPSGMHIAAWKR